MEVRDKYIVDFIVNVSNAIAGFTKMERAANRAINTWERAKKTAAMDKELKKAGLTYNKLGVIVDRTTKQFVSYNEVVKRTAAVTNQASKKADAATQSFRKMEGNLLSLAMSTFFFGMALKTVATNLLNSLVTAFVKARGEGDFFVNRLLAIQAAFEFLKFAIFDTFANTGLFLWVTEAIINMTNAVSGFVAKHPYLTTMGVGFIGLAIAIGLAFMVVGFLAQGLLAVVSVGTKLPEIATAFALIGTKLKYVIALTWYWIKVLALPIVALALLIAFVVVTKDRIVKQFEIMKDSIKRDWEFLVDTLKRGWAIWAASTKLVFTQIIKAVVEGASWAVEKIVGLINKAISAYMRLPRRLRKFGDIDTIDFKGFNTTAMTASIDASKKKLADLKAETAMANAIYATEVQADFARSQANLGGAAMDWNQFLGETMGLKESVEKGEGDTTETETTTIIQNNDMSVVVNGPDVNAGDPIIDSMSYFMDEANKTLLGAPQKGD